MQNSTEAELAASKTVQVIAFHPNSLGSILWVHNLADKKPKYIPRYYGQAKPSGWGNGGGGLEPNELELLEQREQTHPAVAKTLRNSKGFQRLSNHEKAIVLCGLRELADESGYSDLSIEIPPDDDQYRLLTYTFPANPETGDEMHQVITLCGHVNSFVRGPIIEANEIDMVNWLDISLSLPFLFSDKDVWPDRPYWSHVRRVVLGIQQIDRNNNDIPPNRYSRSLENKMHPFWRLVFPVGKSDPRFPHRGYQITPLRWYELFEWMSQNQVDMVDLDFIYERFQEDIEKDCCALEPHDVHQTAAENPESVSEINIPAQVIKEENELWEKEHDAQWREWAEREFGV